MAQILKVTETGDGQVLLHVDVAVDTIATVTCPTWLWLTGGAQALADAYAARYAARRRRLRGDTP